MIWRNGLSAVLPLHGQIRGNVVRKPLKESKHANCRCQRRALHNPELLAVGFVNTVTHGCPILSQRRDRAVYLTTLLAREWVSSLHMLARALLGIEKTDRNRCTGLYKLYVLHPANVRPQLASSRSCEGAPRSMVPIPVTISVRLSLKAARRRSSETLQSDLNSMVNDRLR